MVSCAMQHKLLPDTHIMKINGHKSGQRCAVDVGLVARPVTQLQHHVVLVEVFQHAINLPEMYSHMQEPDPPQNSDDCVAVLPL